MTVIHTITQGKLSWTNQAMAVKSHFIMFNSCEVIC